MLKVSIGINTAKISGDGFEGLDLQLVNKARKLQITS